LIAKGNKKINFLFFIFFFLLFQFISSCHAIVSTTTTTVGLDKGKNIENPNKGSDPYDIAPTHHVPPEKPTDNSGSDNVYIMNTANEDRTTSFFAQPGILAGKHILSIALSSN
jgi:hypothetical protein